MFKRILSSFLVLATLVCLLPPRVTAERVEDVRSDSETTMEATNSFGGLLANTLSDTDPSGSESFENKICDLRIDGTTACVEYCTQQPAKLVVAVYTEDGSKMLGSGVSEADPEETETFVDIQISPMPRYYSAGAYLLDAETNEPLSPEFRTQLYTKAVQDVRDATVDDFDPAKVLNLDDDDETNFAVFGDNTLFLYEGSTYTDEPVTFAQSGEGVYIFENAGPELLALKPGDNFVYALENGELIIAKAMDVQISGNTVTVTEDTNADLSDVFEVVKLETDCSTAVVGYDDTGIDPDITPMEEAEDVTFPEESFCYEGEADAFSSRETTKHTFKKSFSVQAAQIKGTLGIKWTTELCVYIKLSYVYASYKMDTTVDFTGEIFSDDLKYEPKIGKIPVHLPYGIKLEIIPGPKITFTSKGAVSFSVKKTVGTVYDSDLGTFRDISGKPSAILSLSVGGKIFFGAGLTVQLSFLSEKICSMGITASVGVELNLTKELFTTNPSAAQIHLCDLCYEGQLDEVGKLEAFLKAFNDALKTTGTLWEGRKYLRDAHLSYTYSEFSLDKCPHKLYRLSISKATSKGAPCPDVQYQLFEKGGGELTQVYYPDALKHSVAGPIKPTDANGTVSFYLPNGEYELAEGGTVVKSFTILNTEKKLRFEIPAPVIGHLSLSEDSINLYLGNTESLRAVYNNTVTNLGVTNACSWASDNPEVVRVERGILTPVGVGTAWITASYIGEQGIVTAFCYVTVDDKDPTKCGDDLRWSIDSEGTMTITGTGDMWDYYYYMGDRTNAPWFDAKPKKLVVSEGVTSIGASSFSACSSLKSVKLPSTVTNIGDFSFMDCTSLTLPKLPAGLTRIGCYAFSNCTHFTGSLVIPDGVTIIRENAFEGCTSLTGTLKLSASLSWIGERAFYDCPLTGTLTLPKGITDIDEWAFSGGKFSGPLNLPANLTSVGYAAFGGCCFTGDLVIPKALAQERFDFEFTSFSGSLILPEQITAISGCFEGTDFGGDVIIPGKVTVINEWAFYGCEITGKLTLPASLKEIEANAFRECSIGQEIWYQGTAADWAKIKVGEENSSLNEITIHFSDGTTSNDQIAANHGEEGSVLEEPATPADIPENEIPETEAAETAVEETDPEVLEEPTMQEEPETESVIMEDLAANAYSILPDGVAQHLENMPISLAGYTGKETIKDGARTVLFTGLEPGEEYVLIVSLQPGSVAPEDLQYIEQATASADGGAQFTYIPRTDVTALTQLYGISAQRSLTLDREYLSLALGNDTETLTPSLTPAEWASELVWSSDNKDVASVDQNGNVSPISVGTAYISASVTHGRYTLTARCRIDVTEKAANEEVLGVDLGSKKVTSELYSTDYAEIDVLLRFAQNEVAAFAAGPADNGAAITGARLEDENIRTLFDLKVKDDRHLLLVPTQKALDAPAKQLKGSYSSHLTVTVGGVDYRTADAVTIMVKKSLPKLKAANLTFNSFYTSQSQALTITGGTVTRIEGALPQWLRLDGTRLTLNNAPKSGSAALNLQVYTSEWAIPAQVKLTAKLVRKAPSVKLSATSVTLADKNGTGISLALNCGKETPETLGIQGLILPDGFQNAVPDSETGAFRLIPVNQVPTGKQSIGVRFYGTDTLLELPLTIKAAAPTLKLSKSSVSLNGELGDEVTLKVTANPADLDLTKVTVQNPNEALTVSKVNEDGEFTVAVKKGTAPRMSYTLTLQAPTGKAAKLTVKTLNAGQKVTMTLKATGNLDLTFPEKGVTLTPTFKNYSGSLANVRYGLTLKQGKANQEADFAQYLKIGADGKLYAIGKLTNGMIATVTMTGALPDGTELSAAAQVKVTETGIPLKLSKSSLTLNKKLNEWAAVEVSTAAKGYTLGTPSIQVTDSRNLPTDALTAAYEGGKLTVALGEKAQYGASYKVLLWVTSNKVSTLNVKVPTEKASDVTVTAKATGSIDPIRSASEIVITPSYKNYLGQVDLAKDAVIYWAQDGKNFAKDVTGSFRLGWSADGKLHVRRAGNVSLTGAYRLELTVEGASKPAYVKLNVKSGSAKLTAEPVVLYAKDGNSRAELKFISTDPTLNPVNRVTLKDAKQADTYWLRRLEDGTYVLSFQDEAVRKSGSVALNVFIAGNTTRTPNATVTVKVEVR